MSISFKIEDTPSWMPPEERYCRACDCRAEFVVVAVNNVHVYPCCDQESCQEEVKEQIRISLGKKVYS